LTGVYGVLRCTHMPETKPVTFRLAAELLARLDKVAVSLSRPGLKITRSDVLKMAVIEGLRVLEKQGKNR
jgi:hypothetical protein